MRVIRDQRPSPSLPAQLNPASAQPKKITGKHPVLMGSPTRTPFLQLGHPFGSRIIGLWPHRMKFLFKNMTEMEFGREAVTKEWQVMRKASPQQQAAPLARAARSPTPGPSQPAAYPTGGNGRDRPMGDHPSIFTGTTWSPERLNEGAEDSIQGMS